MSDDLKLNGSISAGGYSGGPVSGTTGTFSGAVVGASFATAMAKITPEGGLAVLLTNKTGAASIKGTIVTVKSDTDNAINLVAVDGVNCLGVVYEDGKADAASVWVVVKGIAQVLMKNASTRGHMCRIGLTADTGEAAGYAMDAAQPTTTASIYKIGTCLESKDAEALCKVLLD